MPVIIIALMLAAALGGGAALAAQGALPDNILWGFKTSINEQIQGTLAADDAAKALWDIDSISMRLQEAQKLAAAGKLDASAQAAIVANFDKHARDIGARITNLQLAGKTGAAADIAAQFQTTLVKEASLVRASAAAGIDIEPFLAHIRSVIDSAATLSADTSAQAQ